MPPRQISHWCGLALTLGAILVASISRDPVVLGFLWIAVVGVSIVARRSVPLTVPMSATMAATLFVLQRVNGVQDIGFVLKSACLILVLPLAFGYFPWLWLGRRALGGVGLRAVLFLVFTRHFALILLAETRQAYIAWRTSTPRTFGPGAFRSLAWATARIFERALARAERFYAARVLEGFPE
jgi:hypothetical protein